MSLNDLRIITRLCISSFVGVRKTVIRVKSGTNSRASSSDHVQEVVTRSGVQINPLKWVNCRDKEKGEGVPLSKPVSMVDGRHCNSIKKNARRGSAK